MRPSSRSKAILVAGTVKAWHVVFIAVAGWAVGIVAGSRVASGFDPSIRYAAAGLVATAIADAIYLTFFLAIREFRRALPILFARPVRPVDALSMAWTAAAMFFWGFGLFRLAFLLPMLTARPDLFHQLAFAESLPDMSVATVAGILFMSSVCAPFGEELLFRGYLLNLMVARKGIAFGVAASSLVFGALHSYTALHATVMGLVFALVYLRYDSLWPGIALHALYNFASPLWAIGGLVSIKPPAEATRLSSWILEIVFAVLFFPAAWQFWRRFRPRGA
jgi:membrane protease YdiL (CAAX protease family)